MILLRNPVLQDHLTQMQPDPNAPPGPPNPNAPPGPPGPAGPPNPNAPPSPGPPGPSGPPGPPGPSGPPDPNAPPSPGPSPDTPPGPSPDTPPGPAPDTPPSPPQAKIVNLDGNYSTPMPTDDGTTTNIAEYFEYHIPYQPTSLGIGSIVDIKPESAVEGGYPPECILITSNESTSQGFSDWYLGLLPSNLEMLNDESAPPSPSPDTPPSPDVEPPEPSWWWINLGNASLTSAPEAPTSAWRHLLYMPRFTGVVGKTLDFSGIEKLLDENNILSGNYEMMFPLPSEAMLRFQNEGHRDLAHEGLTGIADSDYMTMETSGSNLIFIQITQNEDYQDPEDSSRWVPFSPDSSEMTEPQQQQDEIDNVDNLINQIEQENNQMEDNDLIQDYGPASNNPFVEEQNVPTAAELQTNAANQGLQAGNQAAENTAQDRSNNTEAARNAAESARDATTEAVNNSDESGAMENAIKSAEEAQRALGNANPNNPEDVDNANAAREAATDALTQAQELNPELTDEIQAVIDELNAGEIGESQSLAQSFAEEAVDNRDTAIEALNNENPEDAIMAAVAAVEAAQNARETAIDGDQSDRNAVAEAMSAAQQALDAAEEAGADVSDYQTLLDQTPPFNELDEALTNAEARNRDTMPGEFADSDNPDLVEDIMAVAENAVETVEQALPQANPANLEDDAKAQEIVNQAQQVLANAQNWGIEEPDALNELQERINEAVEEYQNRKYAQCGIWDERNDCWYRDATGQILIFASSEDALIYAVREDLITEQFMIDRLPENWQVRRVAPTGRGEI